MKCKNQYNEICLAVVSHCHLSSIINVLENHLRCTTRYRATLYSSLDLCLELNKTLLLNNNNNANL